MIKSIDWSIETRPLKEKTRKIVASRSGSNKKFLLVMPGSTGKDVVHLLEKGVATCDSQWVVIERKRSVLSAFKKRLIAPTLSAIPENNIRYHQGEFSELSLKTGAVPDFAWFDLCGNLTRNDSLWIKNHLPITSNLDLFFTFSASSRGNQFLSQCKTMLFEEHSERMFETIKHSLKRQLLSVPKKYNEIIATHWHLLQYLLPPSQAHCYLYQDTNTSMILYHLSNFDLNNGEDGDEPFHFASDDFDKLLGLRLVTREEVIDAILSANNNKNMKKAKELLSDYKIQNSGDQNVVAQLQQEIQEIRNKQQQAIFG